MCDHEARLRAGIRRALDEAEAASRRRGTGETPPVRTPARRALGIVSPVVMAALLAVAILSVAPQLHRTGVAVHTTPPASPSAASAPPTLMPISSTTHLGATLPKMSKRAAPQPPAVVPTSPLPTLPPWVTPPQIIHQPQLFWFLLDDIPENSYHQWSLRGMTWSGDMHAGSPGQDSCDCAQTPRSTPAVWFPSPDGTRILHFDDAAGQRSTLNYVDTLPGYGSPTEQFIGGQPTWLSWDGDNVHLCRLDGTGGVQLSFDTPGSWPPRPVAALPALGSGDYWWIVACSSARDRVVVAHIHPATNATTMVDLRTLELSSGQLVHDLPFAAGTTPALSSGDGTVVAVPTAASTAFYDTETGTLLHTGQGYTVKRVSWFGARVMATTTSGATEDVDWRHDLVVWSTSDAGYDWLSKQGSDDLTMAYHAPAPPRGQVSWAVIVDAAGVASSHVAE